MINYKLLIRIKEKKHRNILKIALRLKSTVTVRLFQVNYKKKQHEYFRFFPRN